MLVVDVPPPVKVRGKLHVGFQNFLVRAQGVVVVKWGIAREHLEDEDPQSPPVDRHAVPFVQDYLGSEVVGGAAQRVRAGVVYLPRIGSVRAPEG